MTTAAKITIAGVVLGAFFAILSVGFPSDDSLTVLLILWVTWSVVSTLIITLLVAATRDH